MRIILALIIFSFSQLGQLGPEAWAEEKIERPKVTFYPFPSRPLRETFTSPTLRSHGHPEYGNILVLGQLLPINHKQMPDYRTYRDVFSLSQKRIVFSSISTRQPYLKSLDLRELENIFSSGPGSVASGDNDYFVPYIPQMTGIDTSCSLYTGYYTLKGRKGVKQKIVFYVEIFKAPMRVHERCTEQWNGGVDTAHVESYSASNVRSLVIGQRVYIGVPTGLASFSISDPYFESFVEPFPLSPTTWLVPSEWLLPFIGWKEGELIDPFDLPIRSQEELLQISQVVKKSLQSKFPFE